MVECSYEPSGSGLLYSVWEVGSIKGVFFVDVIFGIVEVEVRHMSLLCRLDLGLAVSVVGGVTLAWLALVLVRGVGVCGL